MSDLPVGTVCAFAGQTSPITGSMNAVWSSSACASSDPQAGEEDPNGPVNNVEAQSWMLCDGRTLGTADYPELFAVLGTLYGSGNVAGGAEGFVIPDYRGLFLRGTDAGAGMDPDAEERLAPTGAGTANMVGSLQCDALEDHTHDYNTQQAATISNQGQAAALSTTAVATSSPNPPALVSTETRARNIAVSYVIKFR